MMIKSLSGIASVYSPCVGIYVSETAVPGDFPLHSHDYYELELVLEGKGMQWINGQMHVLQIGSIYLLCPGDLHRLQVEMPLRLINIKIAADNQSNELQHLLSARTHPAVADLSSEILNQTIQDLRRIQQEYKRYDKYATCRATSLLVLTFTTLFRISPDDWLGEPTGPTLQRFILGLHHIREHCQDPLNLNTIAAVTGFTPNYLSHLFPEMAGCSFVTYVTRMRLLRAQILLTSSNEPVTGVAFACGFGSLPHFLRTFHKYYGLTPGQYRLQQRM